MSSGRLVTTGNSMFPLLHPGDVIVFDRLAYVGSAVSRGDVVVFQHPSAASGRMVKLAAGLPGVAVEVRGDRLWIDGREMIYRTPMVGSLPGRWTVGPDEIFVLSVAVAVGTDSRSFGPVKRDAILGRAWYVLPPSPRAGRIPAVAIDSACGE
jgi:signal peptidase I